MDDTPIDPRIVESVVEDMMQGHGLRYFPDWLERRLYKNIMLAVLKLADSLFRQISLRVLGHDIVIDIRRSV